MKNIILITGGCRSGKSRYAIDMASHYKKKVFIATSEHVDAEMSDRISRHRENRGRSFETIEEPLDISKAIKSLAPNIEVVLIDCLTVWLGNLIYKKKITNLSSHEVASFLEILNDPPCDVIIITNEVGLGIVPVNLLARQFRDIAGEMNQKTARLAGKVVFMVAGIPMLIKGERNE